MQVPAYKCKLGRCGVLVAGAPAGWGRVSALGEGGDRWHSLCDLRRDRVCPCPPLRWWCLTPKTRSGWRDQGLVFHPHPLLPSRRAPPKSPVGSGSSLTPPPQGTAGSLSICGTPGGQGPHLASSPGIQQALNKCELNEYTRRRGAVRPS